MSESFVIVADCRFFKSYNFSLLYTRLNYINVKTKHITTMMATTMTTRVMTMMMTMTTTTDGREVGTLSVSLCRATLHRCVQTSLPRTTGSRIRNPPLRSDCRPPTLNPELMSPGRHLGHVGTSSKCRLSGRCQNQLARRRRNCRRHRADQR